MIWPPPWPDEAWLADIALHGGRTDLFGSYLGLDRVAGWLPPLYWMVLRVWLWVWGADLGPQRGLSLVCALGATVALWRLSQRWGLPGWVALGAWLSVSWWRAALTGRPDMLCLALALWCLSLVGWRAGLAGGLALCTHPVALPVLLRGRGQRWVWWAALAVPLACWGVYVLWSGPGFWWGQWWAQLARKGAGGSIPTAARLAWHDPVVMGCAVLGLVRAPAPRWALYVGATGLAVYLGGERGYPVYLVPWAVLGVGRVLWDLRPRVRRWALLGLSILCLVVLGRSVQAEAVEVPDWWESQYLDTHIPGGTIPDPYWYVPDPSVLRYTPPL